MKHTNILIFFTFLFFTIYSNDSIAQDNQLTVYKTYKEYKSDKGTSYKGDYKLGSYGHKPGVSNRHINFKNKDKKAKENKKVKVSLKKIWGFKLNDMLFRIDDSSKLPIFLRSEGEFCYYENGLAILRMHKTVGHIDNTLSNYMAVDGDWGVTTYVSKTIESKTYKFSGKKNAKKALVKLPEAQELHDCVFPEKYRFVAEKMRACVESMNE